MTCLACHRSAASGIDERDDLSKTLQIIGNSEIAILGTFLLIG